MPCARSATSAVTTDSVDELAAPPQSSEILIASTSAEPTTTPSADFADRRGDFGVFHPEPDRDRKIGVPLQPRDRLAHLLAAQARRRP